MNGGLINRAEALKAIDKLYLDGKFGIYNDGSEIFVKCHNAISNVPAADAEQVKCGRWLWQEGEEPSYRCSVCDCAFDYGHMFELFDHGFARASYCPNCGARMDGEVQNDG